MSDALPRKLLGLTISILVVWLFWKYYHRRRRPAAERYSTLAPRIWAGVVNTCVFIPLAYMAGALLHLNVPKLAILGVTTAISAAYLVFMHGRYGQTIGKMATKIRVVDFRTGRGISWRQAWLREGFINLALSCNQALMILAHHTSPSPTPDSELISSNPYGKLTIIPILVLAADVLTTLASKKRRALHDFIAGTVTVRTDVEDGLPQQKAPSNGGPALPPPLPVATEPPAVA